MAPLDGFSDLSIRAPGQAIGGARARREVTATSQTQRRAWASRWAQCSFFRSCCRFRECCGHRIRHVRPRRGGIQPGRLGIAHRWTIERKTIGVVHEAVEDGVGEGRITEHCRAPQSSIGWCPRSRLRTRDIPYSVASLRHCRSARHEVPPISLCNFPMGGDARSECRRLILASPPSHRTRRGLRCPGSACVPLSH